jgi:hypothetical protein
LTVQAVKVNSPITGCGYVFGKFEEFQVFLKLLEIVTPLNTVCFKADGSIECEVGRPLHPESCEFEQ